jgi:hypothetical protein
MKHIEDKIDSARDSLTLANKAWEVVAPMDIGADKAVNAHIRHAVFSKVTAAECRLNTLLIEYHTDSNFESDIVNVIEWSRDCDLCESTKLHKLPATIEAYDKLEEHMYEWSEGSWELEIISPKEAESFEPHFRDRVAEMEGY